MGHIKEPKGVDLIIQSRPLKEAEELAISEYIKNYKLQNASLHKKAKQKPRKGKNSSFLTYSP
ncbi:MAG: hypothetical protein RL660_2785 [Bacteroidota bacterium]|jgi:hypothetical protein